MNLIIKPQFKRDRDKVSSIELLKELAYKLEQIEKAHLPFITLLA